MFSCCNVGTRDTALSKQKTELLLVQECYGCTWKALRSSQGMSQVIISHMMMPKE